MKKHLPILIACCTLFAFASFSNVKPESCSIIIKKGTITVSGNKITPGWELSNFKIGLGDSDRTRDGYNKTHTYDNLGIVLFEPMVDKKPGGIISEFQIFFSVPEKNDVTPTGDCYKGSIKIDKFVVTKDLSSSVMLAKLKGWKKTESYTVHSYRMAKGELYIYFLFNNEETNLQKVSVGVKKK